MGCSDSVICGDMGAPRRPGAVPAPESDPRRGDSALDYGDLGTAKTAIDTRERPSPCL
jgi:hypothetical protein